MCREDGWKRAQEGPGGGAHFIRHKIESTEFPHTEHSAASGRHSSSELRGGMAEPGVGLDCGGKRAVLSH